MPGIYIFNTRISQSNYIKQNYSLSSAGVSSSPSSASSPPTASSPSSSSSNSSSSSAVNTSSSSSSSSSSVGRTILAISCSDSSSIFISSSTSTSPTIKESPIPNSLTSTSIEEGKFLGKLSISSSIFC